MEMIKESGLTTMHFMAGLAIFRVLARDNPKFALKVYEEILKMDQELREPPVTKSSIHDVTLRSIVMLEEALREPPSEDERRNNLLNRIKESTGDAVRHQQLDTRDDGSPQAEGSTGRSGAAEGTPPAEHSSGAVLPSDGPVEPGDGADDPQPRG